MRNDQPYLTPVGINIKEFEDLWNADTSADKTDYAKALAYIYHMYEYDSPYYDRKNKEAEIIKDFIGKKNWKPSKAILTALAKYASLDETAERRVLDATVASCDNIASDLSKLRQETDQLEVILKELDKEIKQADEIERKVLLMRTKLDLQEQKMKISKMIMDMMPKLEKTVETAMLLRRKVTKAIYKGESSDSTIVEFLYDKLMDELTYEQNQDEE